MKVLGILKEDLDHLNPVFGEVTFRDSLFFGNCSAFKAIEHINAFFVIIAPATVQSNLLSEPSVEENERLAALYRRYGLTVIEDSEVDSYTTEPNKFIISEPTEPKETLEETILSSKINIMQGLFFLPLIKAFAEWLA